MLQVLTPLEETRAYQQLVGIVIEKGKKEGREEGEKLGRQKLLAKLIRRRFGALPRWASTRLRQADIQQLEAWADSLFEAKELTDLLGPRSH
ncbi:MAG: hypothetical protein QG599_1406 [Pseudomonadota bacterium]|nr:hypothetical protein [Pseudomonadota bacterium]